MPLLPDISTHGFWIDYSILIISIVSLIVGILSFALVILALIRYRQGRNPTATRHLSGWITRLVVLDFVMIVFDIVIAVYSTLGWQQTIIQGDDSLVRKYGDPVRVKVVARQFFWSFNYPGPDNTFDTADDFTLANQLVVPQNKLVILTLTSKDVIHSFFAPNLRVKYDVVPGRDTRVWFVPEKTGRYTTMCTELCGIGHSRMLADIDVITPEGYQGWLETKTVRLGAY
jgi:cytochrome c oxidase subunit 2